MMKYLVTGSTGFVGSRLLGFLNTIKCDVRLLARSEISDHETVVCNLGKDRIPGHTLDSIDTVFHLAGFTHDMQDSRKVEDLYRVINLEATVELARLAVESGVKRFVFVSSIKAGGLPLYEHCASECDQNDPEGIYGKTKREAELKLLKIGKESGMHVSIIRPSLVYGPNAKGNLQLMLSGLKKGWFPPLPETGNKRSMIHVDDLVLAIFLVANDDRTNGEIFIVTDGAPHSSREIYNAMCRALNKSIPKWSIPKLLFDMASLINPRIKYKLNKLLGDECYSSAKLESLGFKAQKTLKDMNETDF
jgi:UDP-glucose 4-epimerase